jgi:hypothetical protein
MPQLFIRITYQAREFFFCELPCALASCVWFSAPVSYLTVTAFLFSVFPSLLNVVLQTAF